MYKNVGVCLVGCSSRFMQHRTPPGASPLAQSTFAWSVIARRVPSRHCRDARVYDHTTTAMHHMSTTPPPLRHHQLLYSRPLFYRVLTGMRASDAIPLTTCCCRSSCCNKSSLSLRLAYLIVVREEFGPLPGHLLPVLDA